VRYSEPLYFKEGGTRIFPIEDSQTMPVRPFGRCVCLKKGKVLGSDKVNGLGHGLCNGQRISEGTLMRMIGINFYENLEGLYQREIFM
jgi:cation transport regulator ChaC